MQIEKDILKSFRAFQSLPDREWRKDFFSWETGGFVATHVLKGKDDLRRPGIVAEASACMELASKGKRVLRLPENIPELIDNIIIEGKPFRELLKYKQGATKPRGYPDMYYDSQTWDFKAPEFNNNID